MYRLLIAIAISLVTISTGCNEPGPSNSTPKSSEASESSFLDRLKLAEGYVDDEPVVQKKGHIEDYFSNEDLVIQYREQLQARLEDNSRLVESCEQCMKEGGRYESVKKRARQMIDGAAEYEEKLTKSVEDYIKEIESRP